MENFLFQNPTKLTLWEDHWLFVKDGVKAEKICHLQV